MITSIKSQILIISILFNLVFVSWGQNNDVDILRVPLTKFFEPSDYNGGIQNWAFTQDSSGVLYVANNYGLLAFNGGSWTLYNVPSSTKIRSTFADKDTQRIYVGGQGQIGYFELRKYGYEFTSLIDQLPSDKRSIEEVWKILKHNDLILFNTSLTIYALKNNKFYSLPSPGRVNRVFSVDQRLIAQFQNMGLFEFIDDQFVEIPGSSILDDEVISIVNYPEGFMCLTTNGKTYLHNGKDLTPFISGISTELRSATINNCLRLSSGDLAVGTQNKGLFIIGNNMELKHHVTSGKGLRNKTVLAIHEDNFQNLWVGLNNGINYIELNSPLSLINQDVGLEGTGYTAALHNNHIYLGTNNGLFIQEDNTNSALSNYSIIEGGDGQVYKLSKANGELILNHHRGAFEVNHKVLKQFHTTGSWKFMPTSGSKFICGDYNGIQLFEKINGNWVKTGSVADLEESSRILEFQNDSVLWMTHGYRGVFKVSFDKTLEEVKGIDFYGKESGFPSNLLISVYGLEDNLIFTAERGIYDFDNVDDGFVQNKFLIDLMGLEHISNISTSPNGDIYFLSDRKVALLKKESFGKYSKEQNVFKRINKLISDDLENISILDERNILIGAKEGFIHYDPLKPFEIHNEFHVVLNEVSIHFESDSLISVAGSYFDEIDLQENHSITFKYAAPYFDGFEDLQYAHRLVGFDEGWSDWSPMTSKEYTNLPADKYTYEVKAKNVYGFESAIKKVSFKILPTWYQTNWAYASYILGAIFFFGFYSYYQDVKHRKEKEILNRSREDAIKSKDAEITQVSRQSQEQIENLKNEKFKSEINHKNNELASVTMHLLNKNEFVTGVKKRIESIVNDGDGSNEELKKIIKTIERNLHEDDSWDQFAYHFDQVHGDFLKNITSDEIKLTPQETKLAAYLRMNMSSKEIANLMNISVRGVELARYRLRKKLKLERDQNLIEYLLQV